MRALRGRVPTISFDVAVHVTRSLGRRLPQRHGGAGCRNFFSLGHFPQAVAPSAESGSRDVLLQVEEPAGWSTSSIASSRGWEAPMPGAASGLLTSL